MSSDFEENLPPNPDTLVFEAACAARMREKQTPEVQAHERTCDDYDLRYAAHEFELPLAPTIADLAFYRASYEELHPFKWDNPYFNGENNGQALPPSVKGILDKLMAQCADKAEALDWLRFTAYEFSRIEESRAHELALKTQETISLYLAS